MVERTPYSVVGGVVVRRAHQIVAEPGELLGHLRIDDDAQAAAGRCRIARVARRHHQLAVAVRAVGAAQQLHHVEEALVLQVRDTAAEDAVAGGGDGDWGRCRALKRMAAKHGVGGNATSSGKKVAAIHGGSFTSPTAAEVS